jgi:hypothetical protein
MRLRDNKNNTDKQFECLTRSLNVTGTEYENLNTGTLYPYDEF